MANFLGGMIFGLIGFAAFVYGKRAQEYKRLCIGIALMAFPYFVADTVLLYVIGVALTAALFLVGDS